MLKVISYGDLTFAPNYQAGFAPGGEWGLPDVQAATAERSGAWPLVAGVKRPGATLTLTVRIVGGNVRQLRDALLRALSPEDESPRKLVVADSDGGNPRYVYAIAESVTPVNAGRAAAATAFAVRMRVHGDVRFRAASLTQDTWAITASGQTRVINNPGSDEAYPALVITPTATKSVGYGYRRFVAVVWRSNNAASLYPVQIGLNTQALISAGKMQADGRDLRVVVDGVERDRWIAGLNTPNTKVWVNLDFQPRAPMTLKTAIPSSGSVASIEVNEDITQLPRSGILYIDAEAFTYANKVNSERKFIGVVRAAKGTAAAAHAVNAAVHWLQHEIWLMYGNSGVSAPEQDDRLRPAFNMSASSNTTWEYNEFGDADGLRAGRWSPSGNIALTGSGGVYTATQRALAAGEYEVLGMWFASLHGEAYGWSLANPCGIVNVAWLNGKRRRAENNFLVHCMNWPRGARWWSWHYDPPSPSAPNVWENWSYSGGPFAVSDKVAIAAYFFAQDVEAGDVTVTLNAAETPVVNVGNEQGGYYLNCVIENVTTGEAIRLTMITALNTALEVDCDRRVVTWLADNSRQMGALAVLGAPRRHWLRLTPGSNTLRFTDVGTTGVTLLTKFEARWL